jgi:hypothetical protein
MPLSLQQLSDRIEIDDLLTRYAVGVDRKDWDLWETCFTSDAFIDYRAFGGTSGNVKEVRAWLEKTMAMFPMSQHMVINREVTIEGDTARCRSGFYNPMTWPTPEGEPQKLSVDGGYYCDVMVRTPEGWRIKERVEEFSYSMRLMQLMQPAAKKK